MEDLVQIKKFSPQNDGSGGGMGRPRIVGFCLRRYGKVKQLAIPDQYVTEGDKVDFFMSESGFAVRISPDGERSITGKGKTHIASIPSSIIEKINVTENGTTLLVREERPNGIWFFPFSQF
jgi:hypothetical protein